MDSFKDHAEGYTELEASSLAVGLPEGLMGNSEVGHLNIGAGRVVWQDVVRIDQTIKNGDLNKNDVIMKVLNDAKNGNGRLHLCGLVSDGGVVSELLLWSIVWKLTDPIARKARPPLFHPQACQGSWSSPCLHPFLW